MKLGFYPRLAWSGIRKNKRLFVPYILASAGTAAVFYIMFYLASTPSDSIILLMRSEPNRRITSSVSAI